MSAIGKIPLAVIPRSMRNLKNEATQLAHRLCCLSLDASLKLAGMTGGEFVRLRPFFQMTIFNKPGLALGLPGGVLLLAQVAIAELR